MISPGGTFLSRGHERCVVRVDGGNKAQEMSRTDRNVSCPPPGTGLLDKVELEACHSGLGLLQSEMRNIINTK